MKQKDLTKAEEEVMQILWQIKKGYVKDVLAEMPEPKPAYNTVSTIVRILEQKELVGHEAKGRSHQYFPLLTKDEFSKHRMNHLLSGYFSGSFNKLVSFFMEKNTMDSKELDELLKLIKEKRHEQ
mgnify:CR=1 FL=1|tara:strand:+ start:94 stop:468 length:375 start_codon:yes stop_codon:yes gene_type:complete